MKRLAFVLGGVLLVVLGVWISRNTYWADVTVPLPPKGEALTNPFYAAQRFAESLGGHTAWDRTWPAPPADAVVVLSAWHWDLSPGRREAVVRWVEAGGRLVVDSSLGNRDAFERWSGISSELDTERLKLQKGDENEEDQDDVDVDDERVSCEQVTEEQNGVTSSAAHYLCDANFWSSLKTRTQPEWTLRTARDVQAARVRVGRGSVTVINASPFRYRALFDGDHGWLFVAATQFRHGDIVRFVSEEDHPSLLTLIWRSGTPAVALMLVVVALLLWRGWVRFGPLVTPPVPARRSLAEQIRGSGQFALRHGGGESLHAAGVRALHEAVSRRLPGYAQLTREEQAVALSRLTGIDRGALAAALHPAAGRRTQGLRNALAVLESARRQALTPHLRTSDGTH
jgi:hypothetical protein